MFRQIFGKEHCTQKFQNQLRRKWNQNRYFASGVVDPSDLAWDKHHEREIVYQKKPLPKIQTPYLAPKHARTGDPKAVNLPFLPAPQRLVKSHIKRWRESVEGLVNVNRPRDPPLTRIFGHSSVGNAQFSRLHFTNTIDSESSFELLGIMRKYATSDVFSNGYIITGYLGWFCNGIDFQEIFSLHQKGDYDKIRTHLSNWYSVLYEIQFMERPLYSICSGTSVGTGAMFWINSNFPIATGQTSISFPEAGIGYFPDGGASYMLAQEGPLGKFMALTGKKILAYDNVHNGWGLYMMDSKSVPAFASELELVRDITDPITDFPRLYKYFEGKMPYTLNDVYDMIREIFEPWRIEEIFEKANQVLERERTTLTPNMKRIQWLQAIIARMREASPFSLKVILRHMYNCSFMSQEQAMDADLQLALKMIKTRDFDEGVRARLFENRKPKWGRRAEDVSDQEVEDICDYAKDYNPLGLSHFSVEDMRDTLKGRMRFNADSYFSSSWSAPPPGFPTGITMIHTNDLEKEKKGQGMVATEYLEAEAKLLTHYNDDVVQKDMELYQLNGMSEDQMYKEYLDAWDKGAKYFAPSYDRKDYEPGNSTSVPFGPPSIETMMETYDHVLRTKTKLTEEQLEELSQKTGLPRQKEFHVSEINKMVPKDVFVLNHYHKRNRHDIYSGLIDDLSTSCWYSNPTDMDVRKVSEVWDEEWWDTWDGNDVDIPISAPEETHNYRSQIPLQNTPIPERTTKLLSFLGSMIDESSKFDEKEVKEFYELLQEEEEKEEKEEEKEEKEEEKEEKEEEEREENEEEVEDDEFEEREIEEKKETQLDETVNEERLNFKTRSKDIRDQYSELFDDYDDDLPSDLRGWDEEDVWIGDDYFPGDTEEEWKEFEKSVRLENNKDHPRLVRKRIRRERKYKMGVQKYFPELGPVSRKMGNEKEVEEFFEKNEDELFEILNFERSLTKPKKIDIYIKGEKYPPTIQEFHQDSNLTSYQNPKYPLYDDDGTPSIRDLDDDDEDVDEEFVEEFDGTTKPNLNAIGQGAEEETNLSNEEQQTLDLENDEQDYEENYDYGQDYEEDYEGLDMVEDEDDLIEEDGLPIDHSQLNETDIRSVIHDPEPFPVDDEIVNTVDPYNPPLPEEEEEEEVMDDEDPYEDIEDPNNYHWDPDPMIVSELEDSLDPHDRQPQFEYLKRFGVEYGSNGQPLRPRYLPDVYDFDNMEEGSQTEFTNSQLKRYWDYLTTPQPESQRGMPDYLPAYIVKDGKLHYQGMDQQPIDISSELDTLNLGKSKYIVPTHEELCESLQTENEPYDPRVNSTGTIDAFSFELWLSTWRTTFTETPHHLTQEEWEIDSTIDHKRANLPYLQAGFVDDEDPEDWKNNIPENISERLYRAVVLHGYSRWPPFWQRIELKLFIRNTPQLIEEFKKYLKDSEPIVDKFLQNKDEEIDDQENEEINESVPSQTIQETASTIIDSESKPTSKSAAPEKKKTFFESLAELEPNENSDLLDFLTQPVLTKDENGDKGTQDTNKTKIDPNWTPKIYDNPTDILLDNPELEDFHPPGEPITRESLSRQYQELKNRRLEPNQLLLLLKDWIKKEDDFQYQYQEALDRIHIKNSLPKEMAPIEDKITNPDYFLLRHKPLTSHQRELVASWDDVLLS